MRFRVKPGMTSQGGIVYLGNVRVVADEQGTDRLLVRCSRYSGLRRHIASMSMHPERCGVRGTPRVVVGA